MHMKHVDCRSEHKFDSGCGWPAYWDNIEGAVERHVDNAYGMRRVEITCSNCGGHLGHVFEGEVCTVLELPLFLKWLSLCFSVPVCFTTSFDYQARV